MAETILDRFVTEFAFRGDTRALGDIDNRVKDVTRSIRKAGVAVFAIGSAVAGAGIAVGKIWSDMETQWSRVSAKTGLSVDVLRRDYERGIQEIGRVTGVAGSEILDGVQKAISAGLRGEAVLSAVMQGAKNQAAGIGTLTDAISSATTLTTIFYDETLAAAAAIDLVAKTAQLGEGESEDFALALKGVAQQAGPLDISLSGLAASLAAISQVSKSVPRGETQMRSFLNWLSQPSDAALKKLSELTDGMVTIQDLQATAAGPGGIPAVLRTLQTLAGGDATNIAELFPRTEARAFFNSLQPEIVEDLTRQLSAYSGTVDQAFGQGSRNLSRQWALLRERGLQLARAVGEELAPVFLRWMELANRVFSNLERHSPIIERLAVAALKLSPALIAVGAAMIGLASLSVAGTVFTIVGSGLSIVKGLLLALLNPIKLVRTGMGALRGAQAQALFGFLRFRGAVGVLGPAFKALSGVLTLTGGTMAAVVVAIIAVVVALALAVRKYWEPLKGFFVGLGEGIREGFEPALEALEPLITALTPLFQAVGQAVGWVGLQLGVAWQWFLKLIKPIDEASDATRKMRRAGRGLGRTLVQFVVAPIVLISNLVKGLIALVTTLANLWGTLGAAFNKRFGRNAGADLMDTLAQGVEQDEGVSEAVDKQLGKVKKKLPASDAEEGPLSQLTMAGRAIMETMARGVMQKGDMLQAAFTNAAALPNLVAAGAAVPAGTGGGPTTIELSLTIENMNIAVPSGDPQRIAEGVGDSLADQLRRLAEQMDSRIRA